MSDGLVFVQRNDSHNAVIMFRRDEDGGLTEVVSVETGGSGGDEPHLPSQGSVVLAGDGRRLLVANAGGDDVTLFAIPDDGNLRRLGRVRAGARPRSVAEHEGLVYVLATGVPAVQGFRMTDTGLEPIADGDAALVADADPAQVAFTPDGSAVVVTERGTNAITVFPVAPDGSLGVARSVTSAGPTPYGFAFTTTGVLVVTEAFGAEKGAAAASSYWVAGTDVTPVTRSAGNGRSEICWVVVTPDDRFAYTTNFADGAVSSYAIAADGRLTLENATAGLTVDGRPGLRDVALTADGRFLYALDADSGSLFGWSVLENGRLSPLGSWGGLPLTAAGLAAT